MTRIIAGSAGGRRLAAPKGVRTRPTADRTKEALFSALASWFRTQRQPPDAQLGGVAVLDLFAGSGAIGLEAASRGAAPVVAVESARPVAALIARNAAALGLGVDVVSARAASYLAGVPRPFDLVFADPPYEVGNGEVEALLSRLTEGWLGAGALVVIERSARDEAFAWPAEFADSWSRRYGETTLYYATTQPAEE
ncbi:MAG: 16S rRNA (guanine(966)-N(2))-methyltransferase RsmD [Propionibacteriaceae bacterium]|nr:16S rRNA (guanine(966)-N(2))-methyltransferase RsmD [Propionibacteriaceae bacterium]